jgi:hypothetical protein
LAGGGGVTDALSIWPSGAAANTHTTAPMSGADNLFNSLVLAAENCGLLIVRPDPADRNRGGS